MKLVDVIADYVALRQSMGYRFTSAKYRLDAFGRAVGADVQIQDVNPDRVLAFLGAPVTCEWHHKYSTLTCFYRYAMSRGHARASPLPITIPKMPPRFVPYIYSHDDIRRLLDATTSYRKVHLLFEPYMFRAVLLLLYGAGLRISEALALRMADVDLSASVLRIRETKFYKSRDVPIGTSLTRAMVQYAAARRTAGHTSDPAAPFFVGRKGAPLTIHTVQRSFRQLRAHAGVRRSDGARYQPRLHDCRHAFAVNRLVTWYQTGADVARLLPKLATYLGHIDLSSTQHYLTMTPTLLQEASRRFERYAMGGGTHE
ncbi:MAG: tyrosine-type recombinase/integrase [bacterium]